MSNTGWDRSLGTSKKEQGIITPPHPHQWKCGCWYLGQQLLTMCKVHSDAFQNLVKNLQANRQSMKPEDIQKEIEKTPVNKPWEENVTTGEEVHVGIVTPDDQK